MIKIALKILRRFYRNTLKRNWPKSILRFTIQEDYSLHMGHEFDLDNPVLFTEKLQWIKAYECNDLMTKCVDKITFKDYIKERLGDGYTAKLIRVFSTPDEVNFENLPEKFVVKSNCQSDGRFIVVCTDRNKLDLERLKSEIQQEWFDPKNTLVNSLCAAYYPMQPKVYIEEYLEEFAGNLNDYKLFCFHGEPKYIYVATEHFEDGVTIDEYPISFYTLDWKKLDVQYGIHPNHKEMPKPCHLEEMIEIAKKLSQDFKFVRVDFFDTSEKLYLAELTFYPGGGFSPYNPQSFDKKMGELLHLN